MKVTTCLFFLFYFLLPATGNSQHFFIHLDKPFYVAGDFLRFKIYDLRIPQVDSAILYLELVSSNQFRLEHQVLMMDSTGTEGGIYLPIDLKAGVYLLRYYRVWDYAIGTNKKIESGSVYLPIYSDLEVGQNDLPNFNGQPEQNIHGVVAKAKRRSRISLPVSIHDQSSKRSFSQPFTISIMQFDYLDEKFGLAPAVLNESPVDIDQKNFHPRSRLILEGKILDPHKKSPFSEKHLALYLPRLGSFNRVSSRDGQFKVELPDFNGTTRYQIISLNPNRNYPLDVIQVESHLQPANQPFPDLPAPTPAIQKYLIQNYKRRLINDLFNIESSLPAVIPDTIRQFNPDKRFLMKDYQQLSDLHEFIKEVMLEARLTSVINDKQSLRLRNKDNSELYRWPAWYMLNGFFAGNEHEMLQFDFNKIKTLELFQRNSTIQEQLDSLMIYTGLFSLQSTGLEEEDIKYGVLKYQVKGWTEPSPWFFKPIAESRTPDLRSLLYWNGQVRPDDQGQFVLDFYTSDLTGLFEIKITGIDQHHQPFNKSILIEVE